MLFHSFPFSENLWKKWLREKDCETLRWLFTGLPKSGKWRTLPLMVHSTGQYSVLDRNLLVPDGSGTPGYLCQGTCRFFGNHSHRYLSTHWPTVTWTFAFLIEMAIFEWPLLRDHQMFFGSVKNSEPWSFGLHIETGSFPSLGSFCRRLKSCKLGRIFGFGCSTVDARC